MQLYCRSLAGEEASSHHIPNYCSCRVLWQLPFCRASALQYHRLFGASPGIFGCCHPSGGVQPHGISIRSQCSVVTTLFSPLSSFAIRSGIGFVAQAPSCGRMKAVLSSAQALARWEGCQWAALPVTPAGWAGQWLWGAEGVTVPRRATRHTQGSARGFHIKEGEKGVKVFC